MLVRDVMTRRVVTVNPSESFSRMVKLLVKSKISGLVVVNKRGKVLGVISEKDLLYKLFPSQKNFYKNLEYYMNYDNVAKEAKKILKFKAKNFISKKLVSISPDEHVLKACSIFLIRNIRRLPVIDKGKLVGIVTTNDVYRNYLNTLIDNR